MPSREQRVRVWRGELKKTSGGLTKDDLVKNRKGKIVSRRKSRQAADQNNLGEWLRNKGDRFQDMPQAHAAKGLKAPKPRPAKPVPEPKRERPPAPKKKPKPRYEEDEEWEPEYESPPRPKGKRKKPKYEEDDEWLPPGQKAQPRPRRMPRPKPMPKPKKLKYKPLPVKPELKPKALMPRPPRPLPKPRKKRKLRRNVIGDDDDMDFGIAPQKVAKRAVLKTKPKPVQPKAVKVPRQKVARDTGRRKPIKLHAREPQPEYVKFKDDLGRSELKRAPEPAQLYPVRKDIVVESAPIAGSGKRFGPRHSDLSVRNIRRKRKKKRVDYTKYFDEDDEFDF